MLALISSTVNRQEVFQVRALAPAARKARNQAEHGPDPHGAWLRVRVRRAAQFKCRCFHTSGSTLDVVLTVQLDFTNGPIPSGGTVYIQRL